MLQQARADASGYPCRCRRREESGVHPHPVFTLTPATTTSVASQTSCPVASLRAAPIAAFSLDVHPADSQFRVHCSIVRLRSAGVGSGDYIAAGVVFRHVTPGWALPDELSEQVRRRHRRRRCGLCRRYSAVTRYIAPWAISSTCPRRPSGVVGPQLSPLDSRDLLEVFIHAGGVDGSRAERGDADGQQ